jgi:hypothetical protein
MTKVIATVQVGDIIKSFDFPGRSDCYIIGTVVEVKNTVITSRVIKAVSGGKLYQFLDSEFTTLVQGAGLMDDTFDRVVIVG